MNQEFDNAAGGGKIYPNKRKTQPSHPGLSGFIKIERDVPAGSVLWISGWVNEPREPGEEKTIGIKVQLGQHGQQNQQKNGYGRPQSVGHQQRTQGYQSNQGRQQQPQDDFDDSIPF